MTTVVGVFDRQQDAERFVDSLRARGIGPQHVNFLVPGDADSLREQIPTTDAEQPGMGAAIGGVVGGAAALSAGLGIIGTVLLPGIGTVTAIGAAMALGAAGGAAAGSALDNYLENGVPADELFVYEDALRHGRTVVFVFVDREESEVREQMMANGAESIDEARERWWLGIRDAAEEEYVAVGGDFAADEEIYRRGCEAAQTPALHGKAYDEVIEYLAAHYPDMYDKKGFRRGYSRRESSSTTSAGHDVTLL